MRWIKDLGTVLLVSLATIICVDVTGLIFKDHLQHIFPYYGVPIEEISRGYPMHHFRSDAELGFDINPNFRTSTSIKPREYKEYDVWGNTYGCFDDEWRDDQLADGIYLAGDSFTWGYAEYAKKFGTILQDRSQIPVFACGVSHTGQRHQFIKFNRLYEAGLRPSYVIVNVLSNDLDNDFFFPHTTVIDGYMVENIEYCGEFGSDYFEYSRLSNDNVNVTILLRIYSLTANVITDLSRRFRTPWFTQHNGHSTCKRSIYVGLAKIGAEYSHHAATLENRRVIEDWITHSVNHGYELIFSFIPPKDVNRALSHPYVMDFISQKGGRFESFKAYCERNSIALSELYYQQDGHFNEKGNAVYAEFLLEIIGEF
ncbi:MAG: hypothetical protein D6B25_02500 [Desulfobulbaceae bacterium]|nr:MAG: hypothetical protein D6B25_02500 [Desulfobulbaceae bacterium]